MIVRVRIEVDDEARRALASRAGHKGLATRYHIASLVDMMVTAEIEDAVAELRTGRNPDREADRG